MDGLVWGVGIGGLVWGDWHGGLGIGGLGWVGAWYEGPRMGGLIGGAWDCRERSKPCSEISFKRPSVLLDPLSESTLAHLMVLFFSYLFKNSTVQARK